MTTGRDARLVHHSPCLFSVNVVEESGLHRGPLGLARRLFLPQLRPSALFARLLVVLMGAKFFLHPAPLDQFLEPSQCLTDRLLVMNPHAQAHSSSFGR